MDAVTPVPGFVGNWINGVACPAADGGQVAKHNPHDGTILTQLARSGAADVAAAVTSARNAYSAWSALPPVRRGQILLDVALALRDHAAELAHVIHLETGKSLKDARGEVGGAVQLGQFYAGEGQRLYGRTTTSGVVNKSAMTVRQPIGVAGLIVAANTPIANVAWKVFPALICGNTVVLKAPEDSPILAMAFARIAGEAGLPAGVLNVVQGIGGEAGQALVEHPGVGVVSFTGSTAVGRRIAEICGRRLARVSLELGGKNALVVADDADLDKAVDWTLLSAYSNAGQRCAAGSRIIVFNAVYDDFKERLLRRIAQLRVGNGDSDDLGPVINERQLNRMIAAVAHEVENGAVLLAGGRRLDDPAHAGGYYLAPTLLEAVDPVGAYSVTELFGPVTALYRVEGFAEALDLVNRSPYGLTAAIHTRSFDRAWHFALQVETGVAVVNGGTFGSEPHMPFGGHRDSGNGTREPGTEALDVYSELKDIYLNIIPERL